MKLSSQGLPVVIAPLVLYTVDFSGNRSKKWNKFDAWCFNLGVVLYDALTVKDVFVVALVMCALCDNVRASELLNHLGSKANKLCRFCNVSSCYM